MKQLNTVLLILTLLFGSMSNAQQHSRENMPADGKIIGKVIDELGNPVEYANVALYRMRDSSLVTGNMSNGKGEFVLDKLKYGKYYLVADFIGFEKNSKSGIMVNPRAKVANIGSITLRVVSQDLDEVRVVADRAQIDYKIDKKVVNVSQNIQASNGSAVDVLENVPSVNVDIEGNVTMRGSSDFTVLIDGRPTVLEGSEALQQIPSSTIEQIEIITNPSAKYDPEGMSGIINIVTKKQKKLGFNGIVNLSAGTGDKYKGDVLLNFRGDKINIFAGYEYRDYNMTMENSQERKAIYTDSVVNLDMTGNRLMSFGGQVFKGGFDLFLGENTTMTLAGDYGTRDFSREASSSYHDYADPLRINPLYQNLYYLTEGIIGNGGDYYKLNWNLKHNIDQAGHELLASAYYASRTGVTSDDLFMYDATSDYIQNDISPQLQTSNTNSIRNQLRGNIDYTKPFGITGKLEAGYQFRYESSTADYVFSDYEAATDSWINDLTKSNELESYRNIQSVYSTFANEFMGLSFMAGMRLEYTDREIKQITTNESYTIDRFDYFPSLHLSKKLPAQQQLQASYSRRIRRPRDRNLNPFPNYSDPLNVRIGNPNLEPEYTNSYELNYQKRLGPSFISFETYYRKTIGKMTRIRILGDNNVVYNTYENLDSDYAYGMELMANMQLYKWWNMNLSGNFFQYGLNGTIDAESVTQESLAWNARANTTFKFGMNTRLQLSGFYSGPSVTAQGEREAMFFSSLALRQDFMKRRMTVTLQVRDIFNTSRHEFTVDSPTFYSHNQMQREGQVITLGLAYKINNYKQSRNKNGRGGDDMNSDFDDMD